MNQVEEKIVKEFATKAHEVWRKGFDPVYAETGVPSKQRIKKNSDGTEGDINVEFDKLHPDWAKENLAAGMAALEAVRKFPDDIDKAADFVHTEWMNRNPKSDWNATQHVPYNELSQVEKDKDINQVKVVLQIMEEMGLEISQKSSVDVPTESQGATMMNLENEVLENIQRIRERPLKNSFKPV